MVATTTQTRRGPFSGEEPEWLVWLLVLVLLAVGLIVRISVTSRVQQVGNGSVALNVPANWDTMASDDPNELVRVSEPMETSLFPATVMISQRPLADMTDDPEVTLGDLALKWTNQQGRDLLSYRVLAIEPTTVKGQNAVKINYVYVTDPILATPNSIPIVAEGQDVLLKQGERLTVVRFLSGVDAYEGLSDVWSRILNSLELK